MMNEVVCSAFNTLWQQINVEFEFEPEWIQGGDKVHRFIETDLCPGEVAKAQDLYGRKTVLVGTRLGTVSLFEGQGGVICNAPQSLRFIIPMGTLTLQDLDRIIDTANIHANIGVAVEWMFYAEPHTEVSTEAA
jgi:hypothetical protein